jgi:16S rRNA (cytidine1402-2'-O)-methyltransferase
MNPGTLYLCPTPLGNLEDVTFRVLRILKEANKIAAEDTRHTRKLLSHFDIHTPLTSYHEHNKQKKGPQILGWLASGQTVALVSDAGMPGIADPGEDLVGEALAQQIPVIALPGPVAAVTALAASGLPSSRFIFYGFIPARGKVRKEMLAQILAEEKTVVFYEAPHRLKKTLAELQLADPERAAVVARELTKIHEEYVRGSLSQVLAHFTEQVPRGECTVLLAPKEKDRVAEQPDPVFLVNELVSDGMSKKDAIRETAKRLGMPRNEVYRRALEKE